MNNDYIWVIKPRVTKEQIRLWIAAMRSEAYGQARREMYSAEPCNEEQGDEPMLLTNENSNFCCLGVARASGAIGTRLWNDEPSEQSLLIGPDVTLVEGIAEDESNLTLGRIALVGIYPMDVEALLVYLNDEQGKNFPEIADWIERVILSERQANGEGAIT